MSYCAIDFGTSNSAVAIPTDTGMRLVPLEDEHLTMPTAVFYSTDPDDIPAQAHRATGQPGAELPRCFGRAAVQTYIEGYEGRLMRSMKSILGGPLVHQTTDLGHGHGVRYIDVITSYLRQLRHQAQTHGGQDLRHVVLGRPVFFVDDDAKRDAQAQASLQAAAEAVGFTDVAFQFEPLAAAFDYEQQVEGEELVLVADIGGGTSDFSVVRVGRHRASRYDRRDDILANHGAHVAGTDFDRRVSLASVMPPLGHGGVGPSIGGQAPRPVPSRVYFDLATWHLINTVYQAPRVAELKSMGSFYADAQQFQRLMKVVDERLGHALVGLSEQAKIDLSAHPEVRIDLGLVAPGLEATLTNDQADQALHDDLERIAQCALETVRMAGLQPGDIHALYFTGGSTGLQRLTRRLEMAFPQSRPMRGDRLASVATGLGLYAEHLFG